MPLVIHDRPQLTCAVCSGTGTVEVEECPKGCEPDRGPGCLHRKIVHEGPCDAPFCWLGRLECPTDGQPAIGYDKGGTPACFDCLHEGGAGDGSGDLPPASVEGLRRAS